MVQRVTILTDKMGNPKGFAYIEFTMQDAAVSAVLMNASTLHGRELKVGGCYACGQVTPYQTPSTPNMAVSLADSTSLQCIRPSRRRGVGPPRVGAWAWPSGWSCLASSYWFSTSN